MPYKHVPILVSLIVLAISFEAAAKDPLTGSGLPLPRFASLRSDQVNLRTGPGTRYPIEWIFRQKGTPLEITAEYDVWRRVRDWEGTEGWIHQSTLSGRRTAITKGPSPKQLYANQNLNAHAKALVEPSAIGTILSCTTNWCQIQFKEVKGFMPKGAFWGAYRGEQFD